MQAFRKAMDTLNFGSTKINEKLIVDFLPPPAQQKGGGLNPPFYKNAGQNSSYCPLVLFQKGVLLSPRFFLILPPKSLPKR